MIADLNDWDCNTPEGLTRANWSDTLELFPGQR